MTEEIMCGKRELDMADCVHGVIRLSLSRGVYMSHPRVRAPVLRKVSVQCHAYGIVENCKLLSFHFTY